VFLVTGDAGFGILDGYQKAFPRRFLNLGVAEQNAMGFSAGLALAGYKVVVYNIVPFVLFRCYEQVRNDVCYQRLPLILVGIGSGVTYAPGGVTHYSVEDLAIARTLPNLVVLSPCDPVEARACVDFAMRSRRPVYIRIAKTGEAVLHKAARVDISRPLLMGEGRGVALLFHGSIAPEAVAAAAAARPRPRLISVPMVQPLDLRALARRLRGIRTVVTVEEHFQDGGLGTVVADWVARERLPLRLVKLGIRNEFIHAVRSAAGLRRLYGIDAAGIARRLREVRRG
jgi:transketolase